MEKKKGLALVTVGDVWFCLLCLSLQYPQDNDKDDSKDKILVLPPGLVGSGHYGVGIGTVLLQQRAFLQLVRTALVGTAL